MTYSLTWLPQVLRDAGLKVIETPSWQSRGHGDVGTIKGVLCHHTNGARTGNMPTLPVLIEGRPDLPGPLSQLGLGRDGTYYVIAAGMGWHAGPGQWQGLTSGNSSLIGIEAENVGDKSDPWPAVQMDAYRRGVAAILKHVGAPAIMCIGHKEWAPSRKDDPNFDMVEFRMTVGVLMGKPAVTTKGLNTNIIASVFGYAGDEGHPRTESAYGGFVNPDKLQCALPARIVGERYTVRATNRTNGKTALLYINDVGPWTSKVGMDPYWLTGARPKAETTAGTNKAGIDLTPAAAQALGIDGMGKVDWGFVEGGKLVANTAIVVAPTLAAGGLLYWLQDHLWVTISGSVLLAAILAAVISKLRK